MTSEAFQLRCEKNLPQHFAQIEKNVLEKQSNIDVLSNLLVYRDDIISPETKRVIRQAIANEEAIELSKRILLSRRPAFTPEIPATAGSYCDTGYACWAIDKALHGID